MIEQTAVVLDQPGLQTRTHTTAEKISLFAPFSSKGNGAYKTLNHSQTEVQNIAALFESETYLDFQASKEAFLNADPVSGILHLATHAQVNLLSPLQSQVLFYADDPLQRAANALSVDEIQNLELRHQLVTLSACDTGIGTEEKGKGVRSLSNAFTMAGVSSTVMSLWQIPDRETAELMIHFYTRLSQGLPKDEALQQAQLAFLSDHLDYPALQHPYYWSGFVLSGDASPLSVPTNNPWYGYIGLGVVAVFLMIFFGKRSFQKP